ncbi:hypothetical protein [Buttiauxella ferragutiae]|uniref:hypothetical protein n=1 Tax=Buttiauxella ferragutiae TaxID=82989 RepID=UPI003524A477
MRKYKFYIVGVMLSTQVLIGCSDEGSRDAMLTVEVFHEQFNLKDFEKIYVDIVSKEFKDSMTKSDYFSLMNKNASVLGSYQYGRLLKSDQVKVLIGDGNIRLTYHSIYSNYELNEMFIIKKEDGRDKIKQIVYDDIHVVTLKEK